MREFTTDRYKGLWHQYIKHNEVNADLTDVFEGDLFVNTKGDRLVYFKEGFMIATDDPYHYLTKKDLQEEFINEAINIWKIYKRE